MRALALLLVLPACKAVTVDEKPVVVTEQDALLALMDGSQLLWVEMEETSAGAGVDLDSDFAGDWPLEGEATLRPSRSNVPTTFVVDRDEMGWPQREWSVTLTLDPLVVDDIRYVGSLTGVWYYEAYQEAPTTLHTFAGELRWAGPDDNIDDAETVTAAFSAEAADGEWTSQDGLLGDTLIE